VQSNSPSREQAPWLLASEQNASAGFRDGAGIGPPARAGRSMITAVFDAGADREHETARAGRQGRWN
jgi:hypothetical protein